MNKPRSSCWKNLYLWWGVSWQNKAICIPSAPCTWQRDRCWLVHPVQLTYKCQYRWVRRWWQSSPSWSMCHCSVIQEALSKGRGRDWMTDLGTICVTNMISQGTSCFKKNFSFSMVKRCLGWNLGPSKLCISMFNLSLLKCLLYSDAHCSSAV